MLVEEIVEFKREVSCFAVPKYGILSITSDNTLGGVEFDFFSIWQQLKEIGLENIPYVYMIHSHPPGCPKMSSIDFNMVHGWCQGLAIPICFIIVHETGHTFYLCQKNGKKSDRDIITVDLDDGLKQIMQATYYLSMLDGLNVDVLDDLALDLSEHIDIGYTNILELTKNIF